MPTVVQNANEQPFGVPGFANNNIEVPSYDVASLFANTTAVPYAENPQKMSFSSESPALAHPSSQIDPIKFNAAADDPSLLDTSTYDVAKANLNQATTVGQFKSMTAASSTSTLEDTYFKNQSALGRDTDDVMDYISAPDYLMESANARNAGATDKDYLEKTPAEQARLAGAKPSQNKIPLMMGAYQHPNFANADPAINNINVSSLSDSIVDETTKLLSAGTPLMSTSAPEPKLFQVGLKTNPEAYWQRPVVSTNTKYYVQQPDGKIGLDPELRIPLPDAEQKFLQPYQPYAQDRSLADLNAKLKLPGLVYDVVGTKDAGGKPAAVMPEYNPLRPPPVNKKGQDLVFNVSGAKAFNEGEAKDAISAYHAASNPAMMTSWLS